jgi:MFS family permease
MPSMLRAATNTPPQHRVLAVLFSGVFLAALDVAIVAPALPLLRRTFAVDTAQVSLFVLVYSLCSLVSTAPLASLSDQRGRRPIYLTAIAGFALGSLVVALAPTFLVALVGRAIQGVSAGGITPAASAVVGDTFPVAQRGKALGLIGATFGMAFLFGPLLASLLLLVLSWHWLFLLNLPVALAARAAPPGRSPAPTANPRVAPFDLAGTLVGLVLLASLMLGINRVLDQLVGQLLWPWLFGLAALCLPLLVWVERRSARPLVPFHLFGRRQINLTYLLTLGAGFGMGSIIYLTSLAVVAFGTAEQQAGLLLLPVVLSSSVASVLSGRLLLPLGSRTVLLVGFAALAFGSFLLGLLPTSLPLFFLATSILGGGVGVVVGGVLRAIVLNEVAANDRAAAQGLVNIGISIGNLLVVATLGAVAERQGSGVVGYATAYLVAGVVASVMLLLSCWLRGAAEEAALVATQQHAEGGPTSPATRRA